METSTPLRPSTDDEDLDDTLSGLTFPAAVHRADQFGVEAGDEIAVAAELARR